MKKVDVMDVQSVQGRGRKFEGIWIPANIAARNDLTYLEKMVLSYFISISYSCDQVFTSNGKLAEYVGGNFATISRSIRRLEKRKFIKTNIPVNGGKRFITLDEKSKVLKDNPLTKSQSPIDKKSKVPLTKNQGTLDEKSTDNKDITKNDIKERTNPFLKIRSDFLKQNGIIEKINPEKFAKQIEVFQNRFSSNAIKEYQYLHRKFESIKNEYMRKKFLDTDFVSDNIAEYIQDLITIKRQDSSRMPY